MRNLFSRIKSHSAGLGLLIVFLFVGALPSNSQKIVEKIRQEKASQFESAKQYKPFTISKDQQKLRNLGINGDQQYLDLSPEINESILAGENELVKILLPLTSKKDLNLELQQIEVLASGYVLTNSEGREQTSVQRGKFYWGYAKGYPASAVVINVFQDEISGSIDLGEETYTLTKIQNSKEFVLYQESDILVQPEISCSTDNLKENIRDKIEKEIDRSPPNADNCVKMYVEVDHDVYTSKNSNTTETYNYIAGAFSQVAILYANENINFTLGEMKIWDQEDPYTGIVGGEGPNTGNYLDQFRDALLGTSFNGDLAHLVGNQGSGGIAYVGVLCNSNYWYGYSGISNSYQNVPTYSWTVNVLTHEIGHNLGSPHTHACAWNGNNTQIDDCGNVYIGRTTSCYDSLTTSPIYPANGGTIMSYCHLISGVGMDFNNGFAQQPGDLIRNNVYNASCLGPCENCVEEGNACDDGDPCTINDAYDVFCNCAGEISPDNDGDGICAGLDPDDNNICIPDGPENTTLAFITIVLDQYPAETSWEIRTDAGDLIDSGDGFTGSFSTVTKQLCLLDGCYDFIINDTYGDGICCAFGNGSYTVTNGDGTIVASGGEFTSSETTNFCYSNFAGCPDADSDDICDDVDPCYDPMIMDMGEVLQSGTYNARQEIILNTGTIVPENVTIYLKAPSVKFMQTTTIPANSSVIVTETPCEN